MIRITKYALISLTVIITVNVSAQNNQVLHFMNLPQNHLINPALKPSNTLFIGLPLISGVKLNIDNNFVNFSDVFMKGPAGDSVISILNHNYNPDKFLAKIKDKNTLEAQAAVQLFGLGFSFGKNSYVFLDINERLEGNINLPKDLFTLFLKGNKQFLGGKIDLSSLGGDLKYYREVGLGFSTNLSSNFRIGIKGKLLFGIAGLSIDNRSFGLSAPNNYLNTLSADLTLNMSGPVEFKINSDHTIRKVVFDKNRFKTSGGIFDFLSGKQNTGLGLDFGATYDISDRLMISAAVTDIGFIKWKKDVTNLLVKSRFEFGGLNIVDVINGTMTFEDLGNELVDTLNKAFSFTGSHVWYKEKLQYCVTLGGSYNITENISLGLLSLRRIVNDQVNKSLMFSGNINLSNKFSSGLSYTISNHQYANFGAGMSFRSGIFQFYILSDRIPLMWNKIKIDRNTTIRIPSRWNTVNFRLGINLVFGNRNRKTDKPMLNVV